MRVAVLMPVYNTPGIVLRASVRSVLQQVHRNLVLCIHQDGGNDVSWIASEDKRIIFTGTVQNHGRGAARQSLLDKLPECDMFTWVDSDDGVMPRYLEYATRESRKLENRDFWYVRLAKHRIRRMNQRHGLAMANTLRDAIWGHNFRRFQQTKFYAPNGSLHGAIVGLFLPPQSARMAAFEPIDHPEDMRWSKALLKATEDRYGSDVRRFGVCREQPLDAMYVRLAPLSDEEKYGNGRAGAHATET